MLHQLHFLPEEIAPPNSLKASVAKRLGLRQEDVGELRILKKSLDARKKPIRYLLQIEVAPAGKKLTLTHKNFEVLPVSNLRTCHIIGFGPAGIFAALQCLAMGIKPIVIERGKHVEERLHDIAAIHKKHYLNPESNYCYGEGGAGTYSDGKLYTRSNKRGNLQQILDTFIAHGADPHIAYESHPHIGTNKLPRIIAAMREHIIAHGGEVLFQTKLVDFTVLGNKIVEIQLSTGDCMSVQHVLLATGHSARDIFVLLQRKKLFLEAKPFAMGVRIEHPQRLIDQLQYKLPDRGKLLPPATYSLVTQAGGCGVFSFCMCPGGVVAPAATALGETVVNGWSSSARNGPYANSGIVVTVNPEHWQQYTHAGPLAALAFQQAVEQRAYAAVGSLAAPAQRVEDFIQYKTSATLPRSSYQPGLASHNLHDLLPRFIAENLRAGLIDFGKKMNGYRTNEAVLLGVESRTSSPVRIPRNKDTYRHPQIVNLLPCGEGAGYAGGIVSAAMDGVACAKALTF